MTSLPTTRKVSVLIPTYKYARFLSQTIESILNQSFSDFELIISDDDSQDGSAEIIRDYASRDARIRFKIQSPNLGMVNNWNWCLAQAQGCYIKYVFGDDFLISQDALALLVELIETEPGVRLAASARIIVDGSSTPIEVWNHAGKQGITAGAEMISQCLWHDRNLIGEPSVVLFRKEDAARGFHPDFKQVVDLEFWMHLLRNGNFAYTETPLCAFRRHAEQQTEVNRRTIDGASEHARLLHLYSDYFALRPEHDQEIFKRLYRLRKKRNPKEYEIELIKLLSNVLDDKYFTYWIRYKVMRPFSNVRRSWRKYVLGIQTKTESGAGLDSLVQRKVR